MSVECGVWRVECEEWSVECGVVIDWLKINSMLLNKLLPMWGQLWE